MKLDGRNIFPGRRLRLLFAVCAAWQICLLSGCATGSRIRAGNLPDYAKAHPTVNARTIDLTRLVSSPQADDSIGSGDVVEVSISSGLGRDETVRIDARVSDRGEIMLPAIGSVDVAGLRLEDAEQAIENASITREIYKAPQITVTMKQAKKNRITVIGAVQKPGTHDVPRDSSDLLAAIVAAGGLADDAGTNIEIRMPPANIHAVPGERIASLDAAGGVRQAGYSDIPPSGSRMQSLKVNLVSAQNEPIPSQKLTNGSVVVVERREPAPIQVVGLVNKPGQFDYPISEDLRLLDALALAGWTKFSVADSVVVVRTIPGHDDPVVVQTSIRKAKKDGDANLLLAPGDVVSVEQNVGTSLMETMKLLRFGMGLSLTSLLL